MEKYLCAVSLAFLLCFTSIFAKEWSDEQKEALNAFNSYIAAARRGNIMDMKSYWHPKYVGWGYAQARPMNYDAFLKIEEDFIKNYRFKKLEIDPLEIQVEGNLAVIHLNYEDVISDSTGKEISASGRWTTIMLKQDKRWVIMSQVWLER